MSRNFELLAPGGDVDSIKAAIAAGADAVYCGLDKFNARNRAANITFEDLNGILRLAHKHNCQVFITLNIIIIENEIPAFVSLLNKLINTHIDGLIVQDLGIFYLISTFFKGFKVHASTQLTTHNEGQILFLRELGATRVNLSRELAVNEIKSLTQVAHRNDISLEVFVHGSNCICFSGICYFSSVQGGNSGNRGRCSQPCRDQYLKTPEGNDFPLNLKDNSAFHDLRELSEAGVDSLKIEGRIKKSHYVYTVVDAWRKQLREFYDRNIVSRDNSALYKVFNREFTNGYLTGNIGRDMFIDNPRDNSAIRLSETSGILCDESLEKAKGDIYDERSEIIFSVENEIAKLSIAKAPLAIYLSGVCGKPLKVSVKTPDTSFDVFSEINLVNVGTQEINEETVLKRLKAINETEYYIEHLDLQSLQKGLFLPFKELTSIKKRLLYILNESKEYVSPIDVPVIKKQNRTNLKPSLSILISSPSDLHLCDGGATNIYFQLPGSLKNSYIEFIDLFLMNKNLIPWFSSVLIGDDYKAAVYFLQKVQPKRIVTNNTGIAYEAFNRGIPWIAGPYLNIVNSFSLVCLKEKFNCCGAFISNELSKIQIKSIKRPEGFELYYRIYYPIELLTSRQCLFQQVSGCEKNKIEDNCLDQCEKFSSIINLKGESFFIEKTKGNYHKIYNETNFLNLDIVMEVQDLFTGFFIDLREVKTKTTMEMDKSGIIKLFERLINGEPDAKEELQRNIHPSTFVQYKKGI